LGEVRVWGWVWSTSRCYRKGDIAKLGINDELGCRGGHAVYRCTGDERGRYTAVSPDVLALGGGVKPRAVDRRGFMVMPQGLRGAVMNNTGNNGLRQLFQLVDPGKPTSGYVTGRASVPPLCRCEGSITGESIRTPVIIDKRNEYDVIMVMLSQGGGGVC